jgi:hypothetical protein
VHALAVAPRLEALLVGSDQRVDRARAPARQLLLELVPQVALLPAVGDQLDARLG